MSVAEGANSIRKCRHRVIFLGQRSQVEKQAERAVIAAGLTLLNFRLDFAPDRHTQPSDRSEARPERFLGRSRLLPPLGLPPFRGGDLALVANLGRTRPQIRYGAAAGSGLPASVAAASRTLHPTSAAT